MVITMNLEAVILALIAAIPPTVTAAAALVVSLRTDRKADDIRTSVNGNIASLTYELRRANETIISLTAASMAARSALDLSAGQAGT